MKLISLFVAVMALGISSFAGAEEVSVANYWVSGTPDCNRRDVQLLSNGNAFSFIFNGFGPQLPENENRRAVASVCVLTVLFQLPQDRCIDHLDETVSGGVLKSKGAQGQLTYYSWMNGLNFFQHRINYRSGKEITPVDPESLINFSSSRNTKCIKSRYQWYTAEVFFTASKCSRADFFLGNIDSIDGEVRVKVKTRR